LRFQKKREAGEDHFKRQESVEIPVCPALLRFLAWPRRDEGAYPPAHPPTDLRYPRPPLRRSLPEEQRSPGQKAKQPRGRERFGPSGGVARSLQTATGMLVARAL